MTTVPETRMAKKAIVLHVDWQINNFARASCFFCTFFWSCCTTAMWNFLISRFIEVVNTRQRLSFSFCMTIYSLFHFERTNKLDRNYYLYWQLLLVTCPLKYRVTWLLFHQFQTACKDSLYCEYCLLTWFSVFLNTWFSLLQAWHNSPPDRNGT